MYLNPSPTLLYSQRLTSYTTSTHNGEAGGNREQIRHCNAAALPISSAPSISNDTAPKISEDYPLLTGTLCPNPNEEYDPCFSQCHQKTCNYNPIVANCSPPPKFGDPDCTAGCRCIDGYVRNNDNICIREKDCKKQCKKPNEVYDVCPGNCPQKICGIDDRRVRCKRQPKPGSPKCKHPACRCKNGYYRDNKGNCVIWRKCPCRKPHEEYKACTINCQLRRCDRKPCLFRRPPMNPKYVLDGCGGSCQCIYGYARNEEGSCVPESECNKPTNEVCDDANTQPTLLRQGNYGFTGKLLYQIVKANPGSSVVTSAFSVLIPLAILCSRSKGNTYTEIIRYLNVKTKQELMCSFPPFLDEVQASEGTELNLAAKIYVKQENQLSDSLKNDAKMVFRAEVESIDFNKANQAADTINQWVSDATKDKIKDLVSPNMLDSSTLLVLVNAIYFRGGWKNVFNPDLTEKADFYIDSQNTKEVDMMFQKQRMNYYSHTDLDAQTIEIPYNDGNITFLVILPNQRDGILDLVEKLQDGATFDRAVSTFTYETVDFYVPKMYVKTRSNMKDLLIAMGIPTIFTNNAQLDGMVVPNLPLYVSHAVQESTISVDEQGSEAATANAFVIKVGSGLPPKKIIVRADHPFVYAIKVRKTLIFCGVYR